MTATMQPLHPAALVSVPSRRGVVGMFAQSLALCKLSTTWCHCRHGMAGWRHHWANQTEIPGQLLRGYQGFADTTI